MIEVFKKIGKVLVSIQRVAGVVLAIAVPALTVYQVILRYVFKAPLMGIEELLLFPVIWLYVIGGMNASQQRSHIECGILTLYMKKEGTIRIFNVFRSLFSAIIGIWLTYWAYGFFVYSLDKWKLSDLLYIPMFFGESALFIGFLVMTLYTVFELCNETNNCVKHFKNGSKGGVENC